MERLTGTAERNALQEPAVIPQNGRFSAKCRDLQIYQEFWDLNSVFFTSYLCSFMWFCHVIMQLSLEKNKLLKKQVFQTFFSLCFPKDCCFPVVEGRWDSDPIMISGLHESWKHLLKMSVILNSWELPEYFFPSSPMKATAEQTLFCPVGPILRRFKFKDPTIMQVLSHPKSHLIYIYFYM